MDKKKVAGIALFLILGLFAFSFANPNKKVDEEEKENGKGKTEEKVNVDTTDEVVDTTNNVLPTVITPFITNTVFNNNVNPVVNNPVVEDISTYKNNAKKELEEYAESKNMGKDYLEELEKLVTDGKNDIDKSNTKDEVDKNLSDAKKKIDELNQKEINDLKKILEEKIKSGEKEYNNYSDLEVVKKEIDNLKESINNGKTVLEDNEATKKEVKDAISDLDKKIEELLNSLPPVITVNGDLETTVELGSNYVELGASSQDVKGGNLEVIINSTVNTNKVGTYKVTYTAIDSDNNKTEIIRTVKVVDTTKPVITLKGNERVEIRRYTSDKYIEQGVDVFDLSEVTTTKKIMFTKPYETESVEVNKIDNKKIGTYKVTYTAKDIYNNEISVTRNVYVIQLLDGSADILIDVIKHDALGIYSSYNTYEVHSDYVEYGIEAKDLINNKIFNTTDLANYLTIDTSNINMNKVGTYTVKYTVKDWAEHTKTATRTIKVVDTTKPVITLTNSTYQTNIEGKLLNIPVASVTDNYDTNLTAQIVDYDEDYDYSYTFEQKSGLFGIKYNDYTYYKERFITAITYKATDSSNNQEIIKYTLPSKQSMGKVKISFAEYSAGKLIWD